MQNTSALYQSSLRSRHRKEIKVSIAGTAYAANEIEICRVSGGLFETPGIGNAAARQIELSIRPKGEIPRQAELRIYVRLVNETAVSEWIPKGVFWISTRQKDKITGSLSIKGFDAMLKAETEWLISPDYDEVNWPMAQSAAVADIAQRMGVQVDSRTVLSSAFPVEYPVDEDGDMTMREVLCHIAVANAGNWTITDEGKLRLIRFLDIPAETNYLIDQYGDAITFGGVRILV